MPAPVAAGVLRRAIQLNSQHADVGLGLVDATVIAVAETVDAGAITTLDHAHLPVVSGQGWELVPGEHAL